MTRPYRPGSGTEGMDFMEQFCDRCVRDVAQNCSIKDASWVYEIDDPRYPKEWVQDEAGARCTAFEPEGDKP